MSRARILLADEPSSPASNLCHAAGQARLIAHGEGRMNLVTLICAASIAAANCDIETADRSDVSVDLQPGACEYLAKTLAGDVAIPQPAGGRYVRFVCEDAGLEAAIP
jgi:hypothetical protein